MATEADIAHGIKIMAAAGLGVPEGWRGLSGSEIARLTAPLLAPLRRFIPLVGGADLTPMAAVVVLQVLGMVMGSMQARLLGAGLLAAV